MLSSFSSAAAHQSSGEYRNQRRGRCYRAESHYLSLSDEQQADVYTASQERRALKDTPVEEMTPSQQHKRYCRLFNKHAPDRFKYSPAVRKALRKKNKDRQMFATSIYETLCGMSANVLNVAWNDNFNLGTLRHRNRSTIKRCLTFLEEEGTISRLIVGEGNECLRLIKVGSKLNDNKLPAPRRVMLKDLALYGRQFTPFWGYLALTMALRCIASPVWWGSPQLDDALAAHVENGKAFGALDAAREKLRDIFPHVHVHMAHKRIDDELRCRVWVADRSGKVLAVAKEYEDRTLSLNTILKVAELCWLEVDLEANALAPHFAPAHEWEINPESDKKWTAKNLYIEASKGGSGESDLPTQTPLFESTKAGLINEPEHNNNRLSPICTPAPLKRGNPSGVFFEDGEEVASEAVGSRIAAKRAKPSRLPSCGTSGLLKGMRRLPTLLGFEKRMQASAATPRMLPVFVASSGRHRDTRPVLVYVYDAAHQLEAVYVRGEAADTPGTAMPKPEKRKPSAAGVYNPGLVVTGQDVAELGNNEKFEAIINAKGVGSRFSYGIMQDLAAMKFSKLFPSFVWSRRRVNEWFGLRNSGVFDDDMISMLEWVLDALDVVEFPRTAPIKTIFKLLKKLNPDLIGSWWATCQSMYMPDDLTAFAKKWLDDKIALMNSTRKLIYPGH